MAQMWKAGDRLRVKANVIWLTRFSLALLLVVFFGIGFFSRGLFEFWLGPGNFVGYFVIVVFMVNLFLEAHQGALMTVCIAAEELSFYRADVLGGGLAACLLPVLITRHGIAGAALAVLIAALFTVNWVIPSLALRLLEVLPELFTPGSSTIAGCGVHFIGVLWGTSGIHFQFSKMIN